MTDTQYEDRCWKSSAYPGWSSILDSWSLNAYNSTRTNIRRVCMWTILLLRTVVSFLMIFYFSFRNHLGSILGGIILLVLNFAFMVWCLAMIDGAEGYRNVLGLRVVSIHTYIHTDMVVSFFATS